MTSSLYYSNQSYLPYCVNNGYFNNCFYETGWNSYGIGNQPSFMMPSYLQYPVHPMYNPYEQHHLQPPQAPVQYEYHNHTYEPQPLQNQQPYFFESEDVLPPLPGRSVPISIPSVPCSSSSSGSSSPSSYSSLSFFSENSPSSNGCFVDTVGESPPALMSLFSEGPLIRWQTQLQELIDSPRMEQGKQVERTNKFTSLANKEQEHGHIGFNFDEFTGKALPFVIAYLF